MKIAVVTGTSTGIGQATSLHLARQGYRVFGAMRNLAKSEALLDAAAAESLPIDVIEMDVCDDESVANAFAQVAEAGPVDVLVNNAGIAGSCPLEDTPDDEHRKIFETNYWGVVRCTRAVAGSMRERKSGCIVNLSSAAGIIASPAQVPYSASKWAVECLSEALAHELAAFDVRVVTIEPGVVKTHIFENSAAQTHFDKTSPYASTMYRSGRIFAAGLKDPLSPQDVADKIYEAISTDEYRLRWPVGSDAERFYKARTHAHSEDWVRLSAVRDDKAYADGFRDLFGIAI